MPGTSIGNLISPIRTAIGANLTAEQEIAQWLTSQAIEPTYFLDETAPRSDHQLLPGRAMHFDGVNDYVKLPDVPALQFSTTGTYTVSMWLKLESAAGGGYFAFQRGGTSYGYTLRFTVGASANVPYFVMGDGGSGFIALSGPPSTYLPNTGWRHFAAVYDNKKVYLYLDGVKIAEKLSPDVAMNDVVVNTYLPCIGCTWVNDSSLYQLWPGKLFDVRLYNRRLTDKEIADMFCATRTHGGNVRGTLYGSDLIGHWRLDDNDKFAYWGDVAFDTSSNGLHGRVYNFASTSFYTGADVPFSYHNELGYSVPNADVLDASFTNLFGSVVNWRANGTDAKSVALTNQTYGGRTGLLGAKFLNGALAGYAQNSVICDAHVTLSANRRYFGCFEVALSRPLVAGETLLVYLTGGLGTAFAYFHADWAGPKSKEVTRFRVYTGTYTVSAVSGANVYLTVLPNSNVTGGDITVYVDPTKCGIYDTAADVDNSLMDGRFHPDYLPVRSDDTSANLYGGPVTHPGPLAKQAKLIQSPCFTPDGINDYIKTNIKVNKTTGTICIRYRPSEDSTGDVFVGAKATNERIYLGHNTSDKRLGGGMGALGYANFFGVTEVEYGRWYHAAISWTGAGASASLYLDGTLEATATDGSPADGLDNPTDQYELYIGALNNAGTPANYSNWRTCDLCVFNRQLTSEEIYKVATQASDAPVPDHHLPLTEGSGTYVHDRITGLQAKIEGATSTEAWANTQDVYHAAITRGFRAPLGKRGYRTHTSTAAEYFKDPAAVSTLGGQGADHMFVAVRFRPTAVAGYNHVVGKSKYSSTPNEWYLITPGGGATSLAFRSYHTDGGLANVNEVSSPNGTCVAGAWYNALAVVDRTAGKNYLILNGVKYEAVVAQDRFTTTAVPFTVGSNADGAARFVGDIEAVVLGNPPNQLDWEALYDSIFPDESVAYKDVTPTQKVAWGLTAWYEANDWGPTLLDAHADNHLISPAGFTADYPKPQVSPIATTPARHFCTFAGTGSGDKFVAPTNWSDFSVNADEGLWVAAMVRPSTTSIAGSIFSKYFSVREWLLYTTASNNYSWYIFDATSGSLYLFAGTMNVGGWDFIFAYIIAGASSFSAGIGVNNGAFATGNNVALPMVSTDPVQISEWYSTGNNWHGDIAFCCAGKLPGAQLIPGPIRDLLYNSGNPLTYDQLTSQQKTDIGLLDWFEVGDYLGNNKLVGRHASLPLYGKALPSRTTNPSGIYHNAALTKINFAPIQTAPWVGKEQFAGYTTFDGTHARLFISEILDPVPSGNQMSVYARIRDVETTIAARNLFAMNGADLFQISIDVGGEISIWTNGQWHRLGVNELAAVNHATNWADVLITIDGLTARLYINGVFIADEPLTALVTWANKTSANVLGHPSSDVANRFDGDISRLIIYPTAILPAQIHSAPNLYDCMFHSHIVEDRYCRTTSGWSSTMTPGTVTIPTAHAFGNPQTAPLSFKHTNQCKEFAYRIPSIHGEKVR